MAVVLHGYVRTTVDVVLFVPGELRTVALKRGFQYRKGRLEFVRDDVPVHLITRQQTQILPSKVVELEEIDTVSLPDPINFELTSGISDPLRAIDPADVIGLIRARRLRTAFASKLKKELRADFRKLARAIERQSRR